jgi:TonB family protein
MSAWKALYVIPLVGISLAATAETKVDYQYEGQQPEAVADTPVGKDSKKSFKEKNMQEGHFIINEEAGSITMVYFDHEGNEMRACHVGLDLSQDRYFVNGNMSTPKAFEMRMEEDDAVLLSAYLKSGKKIRGVVLPNNNYATGTWDASKHPDEQDAVYHKDGKVYKIQSGKYVEIEAPMIRVRDANGNEVKVSESNLVYVINGERMPEGFDLNTIDPKTIASMEVLKTEKALQEYGTDEGVIVITTGEPKKKNDDGKKAIPFQQLAQKPGFNGGDANEFSKYISQNVVYPENCRQSKIEGRVTLEFTVTETGKVADIRILRSVNPDLDREAVRVVAQSPLWTPGRDENSEVVPVKYTFPVIFKLPDSENK